MAENHKPKPPVIRYGLDNPHPLSQLKTELVWDGKYDQFGNRRTVDVAGCAMPLQKIETVDEPRQRAEAAGQLEMFEKQMAGKKRDDFRNRLIWGDNKLVMASLLKEFKGKIDLFYIDPPFDVGADFTMDVPIGDEKETVGKDQSALEMVAYRDMWGKGTDSYLHMMFERLSLMKELLSERGSIYLHCDWRMVGSLRVLMDEIFPHFENLISWKRSAIAAGVKSQWRNSQDFLLFYSSTGNHTFNPQFGEYSESSKKHYNKRDERGIFRTVPLMASGKTSGVSGQPWRGVDVASRGKNGMHWLKSPDILEDLDGKKLIYWNSEGVPELKYYQDEAKGVYVPDFWDATRTLFNLVPCNRDLEVAMSQFLDHAPDVAAFCKNAGPQALRVDYLSGNGQLSFYTPDFLVRLTDGNYVLAETKGRVDKDVPLKVRAAVAWCKAATKRKTRWQFLYVPQQTFETFGDNRLTVLMRTCEPALKDLVEEAVEPQLSLALDEARVDDTEAFISKAEFAALPPAHQKMVQQAIGLFHFLEKKAGQSLAPVFVPVLGPLDEASKAVMLKRLGGDIPTEREAQRAFFEPDVIGLSKKDAEDVQRRARDLKRTLVDHNGTSPIGLLRWCLQSARESKPSARGILSAVKQRFSGVPDETYKLVSRMNTFRNDYVAHQNKELTAPALARTALGEWIVGLREIWKLHR